MVADSADVRGPLRAFTWDTGLIVAARIETLPEGKGKEFEPYFNFKEPVKEIPPHRVLAINRGEKGNILRVRIETDGALANEIAQYHLNLADHPHRDLLVEVIKDVARPAGAAEPRTRGPPRTHRTGAGPRRPRLRQEPPQPAPAAAAARQEGAGHRPGHPHRVQARRPRRDGQAARRRGHLPARAEEETRRRRSGSSSNSSASTRLSVIAIGNGTGCRETEQLVADLIAELEQRRLNPTPTAPEAVTEASPTSVELPNRLDRPMKRRRQSSDGGSAAGREFRLGARAVHRFAHDPVGSHDLDRRRPNRPRSMSSGGRHPHGDHSDRPGATGHALRLRRSTRRSVSKGFRRRRPTSRT